jgi:hypothetical protein
MLVVVCMLCVLFCCSCFTQFVEYSTPPKLILCPDLSARSETIMPPPSTADTPPYPGGVSPIFGMGGGAMLGL